MLKPGTRVHMKDEPEAISGTVLKPPPGWNPAWGVSVKWDDGVVCDGYEPYALEPEA